MTSCTVRTLIACAFASILLGTNASADECKLGRIASMDFIEEGSIVVPVSLDGTKEPMALDSGAPLSAVDPVVAKNLGLIEKRVFQGMYNMKGEVFTYLAVLHDLGMGDSHASNVKFMVWPSPMSNDGRVAGVIGADLLRHYDIDIDFGARKLNLFSQDHCPGRVVYWTNNNVAVVPMHVVNSGHIIVPVTLDGQEFHAVLDTGSTFSHLAMSFAHNLFGLSTNSPGMERVGDISGSVKTEVYRHTFKTLSIGGLTINNPPLYLFDDLERYSATQAPETGTRLPEGTEAEGVTSLLVGLHELNRLHLYIAYQEQKLYITPSSTPVAVAASAPPATAATPASATPLPAAPTSGAAASH